MTAMLMLSEAMALVAPMALLTLVALVAVRLKRLTIAKRDEVISLEGVGCWGYVGNVREGWKRTEHHANTDLHPN